MRLRAPARQARAGIARVELLHEPFADPWVSAIFEEFQQVGDGGEEGGGHGAKAHLVPEVCGTPRRADLGEERGRDGLHVYLHNTGAAWRMS